jgi:hypothetical protein
MLHIFELLGWLYKMGMLVAFLVERVINFFTLIVIPGLTRDPVFSPLWIPAEVYPDENRGRNDRFDATL